MSYIGKEPVAGIFEKQLLSADSSTTSFALNHTVGSESALVVSVGGVLQEPGVAYTLSGGGTNIVFTAAPTSGDRVYVHFLGQAVVQTITDLNGVALILDADADTTLAADTDDQIDIQISGADDFQFTANTFTSLSGSTIKTNTIAETTSASGVTIDGLLLKDSKISTANSIDSDAYIDASIDLAHMSVNSIDSDQYVDGSIDTAHIADNQVTLAKMAGLVRGKIIYGDSSGDPAALTVGSSGQVLKSDGTDISWGASPAAISSYTNSTNNRVMTSVDSSTINSEANLTFDGSTLAVTGAATVSTTLGVTGILTGSAAIIGTTIEPTGDTATSDNAAIGYTSAEGLILTGQGSTNDVTIKNDADADVITIATGATNVDVVGDLTAGTLNADGDTATSDNAAIGYTASEGLILTGQGSTNDVTIKNDADGTVISIPTGTTNVTIAGDLTISGDDLLMATNTSGAALIADGTNFNPVVISGDATIATNGALTIANNAVSLAKMAGGTDGTIITYDASGDPVAVGPGSSGQLLTSAGAGAPPTFTTVAGFDVSSITGATALAVQPDGADEIVLSDAGTLKRLDIKHIQMTPAFYAGLPDDQSLSNATYTKISLATEVLDSDGTFASNKFTPTVAGKYFIFGAGWVNSMNKEGNIFVHLYKNGAVAAYSQGTAPFNATDQASQVSMIVDLDSDDYMELYVYQNGGSTKQCDSGSDTDHTYMGGFRIAGTT